MAWSKKTKSEIIKAYNRLYYWRVTRKKRLQKLKETVKVCPICKTEFHPVSMAQIYCCEECRKESNRRKLILKRQTPEYQEHLKDYRQSENYKVTQKKYRQSEKFKQYKREYQKEYYQKQKAKKEMEESFKLSEEYKNTVVNLNEENNLEI